MMHKSPAIRIVGMISWVLTAVAAMILGLDHLGIADVCGRLMGMGLPAQLHMIFDWAFLIAGAVSFGMFVMAMMHHCGCGDGQCNCKN